MDIRALLDFIEGQCSGACAPVELSGRGGAATGRPLRLVFDADHCLVFFYGGISYGWANGGQWNHMIRFLRYLVHSCLSHKIEICVFFNGTSVRGRFAEWLDRQIAKGRRIEDAIRLVSTKAIHPPKGLWMRPVGYLSVLRHALVQLGLPTASSHSDHQLEIVSFVRDNCFDGIVTCDPDVILFNPLQRYFSARKLNLSHDGILTANEICINDFAKLIGLEPGRLCILATLLGNHILPSEELQEFFSHICQLPSSVHIGQYPYSEKFNAVANFVRNLPSIGNLEEVAKAVFGKEKAKTQLSELFKKSVDYYLQGTRASCIQIKSDWLSNADSSFNIFSQSPQLSDEGAKKEIKSSTIHQDSSTLETGTLKGWESDVLPNGKQNSSDSFYSASCAPGSVNYKGYLMFNAGGYSGSSTFSHGIQYSSGYTTKLHPLRCPLVKWWKVSPEVLHVALERHQKALMTPWIYQILVHGEIFLSPFLEDEREGDLWTAISLYRPIRQKVYSVLLERESKGISDGDAIVREWSVCLRPIPRATYDSVLVPSATQSQLLYSLWLGNSYVDTILRKQMFLDCFGCKPIDSQLLTAVKPQFLILCCILRYMVIQKSCLVIDENTLRAFLATAVSNYLQDPKAIKGLNIPVLSMRSIQLATLFMHGFEAAVFANEAFGMPMPVDLFCPSNYFDGTLFQYKITKISQKASLTELCENSLEQQMHLERMQQTILSSLPKDCAYLCPRLWNTVPRGGSSHNLNLRGESYLQGSYLCSNPFSEIPYPTKGLKDTFSTPPRRALRPNARARPGRGRGNRSHKRNMSESSADKEIVKEENTGFEGKPPEPGKFRIAKRGAIGHQLTKTAPAVPGFGRGRGCTVEIEQDNVSKSSVTHPVVATLTSQFISMIGRGRSSPMMASEEKVDTQNYGTPHDSVLQSFSKVKESHLASDQLQKDKLISCFGDAENSSLHESALVDVAKVEVKAVPLLVDNAAVGDDSLPALIETSPMNQDSPKWADLIDAEEKAISSLSLETEDSSDTLNIAVCLTSPIGPNLD